jgi:hypothetical protein
MIDVWWSVHYYNLDVMSSSSARAILIGSYSAISVNSTFSITMYEIGRKVTIKSEVVIAPLQNADRDFLAYFGSGYNSLSQSKNYPFLALI